MSAVAANVVRRPAKWGASFFANPFVRAVISIAVFIAFWELAARLKWPWIGSRALGACCRASSPR